MVSHLKLSIWYINTSAQTENPDMIWKLICTLDLNCPLLLYFYVLPPFITHIRYWDLSYFSKLFILCATQCITYWHLLLSHLSLCYIKYRNWFHSSRKSRNWNNSSCLDTWSYVSYSYFSIRWGSWKHLLVLFSYVGKLIHTAEKKIYFFFNTCSGVLPSFDKCNSAYKPHLFEKKKGKTLRLLLDTRPWICLGLPKLFSSSGKSFNQTQAEITSNVQFIIYYFPVLFILKNRTKCRKHSGKLHKRII